MSFVWVVEGPSGSAVRAFESQPDAVRHAEDCHAEAVRQGVEEEHEAWSVRPVKFVKARKTVKVST